MGFFGSLLQGMGAGVGGGIIGGLANGISGAVSGLFGPSIYKQRDIQKQLMNHQAKLSFDYGEKAADSAFDRNMKMYERQFEDQSYETQRKRMEDAGLSVGLMYGGGGAGGGGGASTSGQPQGGVEVSGGSAPNMAAMQQASTAASELGMRAIAFTKDQNLKDAQINELNAKAEAARASAGLETEKKISEVQLRDTIREKLTQEGAKLFFENVKWKFDHATNGQSKVEENHWLYGGGIIDPESNRVRRDLAEVAKATAQAGALNEQSALYKAMTGTEGAKQEELASQVVANIINAMAARTNANAQMKRAGASEKMATAAEKSAEAAKMNAEIRKELTPSEKELNEARAKAQQLANGDETTWRSLMYDAIKIAGAVSGAKQEVMQEMMMILAL